MQIREGVGETAVLGAGAFATVDIRAQTKQAEAKKEAPTEVGA